MDVGCYTVKLQICCFNFCLLYMYMYGFFSTRSQNISHLYVLDRLNGQNILMNFNKKMMSCKIYETSVCFVLFGLILLEVITP